MNFVAVLESFDEAVGQVKFSTVVWLHVGLLLKNPNLIKFLGRVTLLGSGKNFEIENNPSYKVRTWLILKLGNKIKNHKRR